jgi:hypothetical protein
MRQRPDANAPASRDRGRNPNHDKEHCMFDKKLAALGLCGAVAAAAAVPATGSASATKAGT